MCDHRHYDAEADAVEAEKMEMMSHGHTGCEHHIKQEIKDARLTREDKRRFEGKYIEPLVTQRVFKIDTSGKNTIWSCSIEGHDVSGCNCNPHQDSHNHDSSDEEESRRSFNDNELERDEEEEIIAKIREQRLASFKAQQEEQRLLNGEWSKKCVQVDFKDLRPKLFGKGSPVICALVTDGDTGRPIAAALGHSAARYGDINFLYCVVDAEKLTLSDEFGWSLAFVAKLPELVCFDNGAYVGHHGSLALSAGVQTKQIFIETHKWVDGIMQKIELERSQNKVETTDEHIHTADAADDDEDGTVKRSTLITKAKRSTPQQRHLDEQTTQTNNQNLASMNLAQAPLFGMDDDSDSDFESEQRPTGLHMRLGSKKRNPAQTISNVIQRIVYRQYSSEDDSD